MKADYLFVAVLLISFSCSLAPEKKCLQKRGAFDIGSGSTKATLALVDICAGKIREVFLEESTPLKFKATLKYNKNKISPKLYDMALKKLEYWKKFGDSFGIERYDGVATEVFRQALNGPEVIKSLKKKTGINISLIGQKEEARLGHLAAVAKATHNPSQVVMWDIGGASMQMVTLKKSKPLMYLGKIASVSFKERLSGSLSPNPLTPVGARQATIKARTLALKDMKKDFIDYVKTNTKEVIGIGGVHFYSLGKKITSAEKDYYDQASLKELLRKYSYYSDRKIKGPYRQTEVSNMALVLGFMEALSIDRVYPKQIHLGHGLLISNNSNE